MASEYISKSELLDILDVLITGNFVCMSLLYFIFDVLVVENFRYTQRQNNTMNPMYLSPAPTFIAYWQVLPIHTPNYCPYPTPLLF